MSALRPDNSFHHFNVDKLMRLAKFYPANFKDKDMTNLEGELRNILIIYSMIQILKTCKVYQLLKLALTLQVATTTVERCFLTMKIVKNVLRNKIGDTYLSHALICFVEKEMLNMIPNEVIVEMFYSMKDRRDED
jgi:hypothetical protein